MYKNLRNVSPGTDMYLGYNILNSERGCKAAFQSVTSREHRGVGLWWGSSLWPPPHQQKTLEPKVRTYRDPCGLDPQNAVASVGRVHARDIQVSKVSVFLVFQRDLCSKYAFPT